MLFHSFTTKEHKTFGHFVTQVRGVKADWTADKTYWAFLKRTSTVDCSVSMGKSYVILFCPDLFRAPV